MTTTTKKATAKKTSPSSNTTNTAPRRRKPSEAAKPVRIASVPDAIYFDEYIGRKFHGKTEFEVFEMALRYRRNVLIEGPTGPGKTSAALAFASQYDLPFYAIPSNIGVEPSQLFGKYNPTATGGFEWQDGPVTDIIRHGGCLLINEVNFMPERVATVLFGLLDKRREIVLLDHKGEVIRAHMGIDCWCGARDCSDKLVLVMADMNPEYEGTRPLNKAFRNRFAIQLNWGYDEEVEKQLVTSESLVSMAMQIREEAERTGAIETPVATNMLQEFEEVYAEFGFDFAAMNFANHFQTDEREAVLQIVRTWKVNIETDLDGTAVADEDTEDADDWGVEGQDWSYEDEGDDN